MKLKAWLLGKNVDKTPLISFPWDIAFVDRLKKLEFNSSRKKVIYIYGKPDASTFRYRVYNICQALESSESWMGTFFFEHELNLLENSIKNIDAVVFVRTPWSHAFDSFFQHVKKYKIPTVFDVDDLVFNIDKIPLILNTLGADKAEPSYSYWFSYTSRLFMMGKMCDATSGTNELLCEQLRHTFDKPSYVMGNFLNEEQIEISEKIFAKKTNESKKSSTFTIGYFSGSPSHNNDFKKIAWELSDLLKKYPEMHLEVLGYMELPDSLQNLVRKKQISLMPFVDFRTLQEKIANVNVNIVPLLNNEFSNCKSELKFFEAAIVGTITCATPTLSYKNCIHHAKNGFLCEEGQWYNTIEGIYKNDHSATLVSEARKYCLEKYSPPQQCQNIEKMLDTITGNINLECGDLSPLS